MRQCLLVATASLLLSTQLHGQNPVTNAPTPTAASILEEAYQLSLSLNHPDDRAAVLSLLIGANGSVQSERLTDWAIELFNAADSTSAPDSAQESAMVALARVDAGRAVEFFRQQKVPSEKASEDTRTFSALALFPALWAREARAQSWLWRILRPGKAPQVNIPMPLLGRYFQNSLR